MSCFSVNLPLGALVEKVISFFSGLPVWKLQDNLLALETSRNDLKVTMEEVKRRVGIDEGPEMERLPVVANWLKTVEDLTKTVDELLNSKEEEIDRLCLCGLFSTNFAETYEFGVKVDRVLQRVAEETKKPENFKDVVGRAAPKAGVERNVESTVGMDAMFEDAWSFVRLEESGTLGIYGMGGVGKTTLLKKINNRLLDSPGDFEFVIFVTVSKDSREKKIQEEIWTSLGLSSAELEKSGDRVQAIFNMLSKKKFVLLLDDLWDSISLADEIGVPIEGKRSKGSKVVLTTRYENVCTKIRASKRIKVEPLKWEHAWELFKDKVGDDTLSSHPEIPRLAEAVAKECAGLPIALITIGLAMAPKNNLEEWKSAHAMLKRSGDTGIEDMDKVFDRLKFSYDNLPNESMKSCFLYCTLFPEDFKILKSDLIDYWICEEFVRTHEEGYDLDQKNEEGYKIIGTLTRACLLEQEGDYVKLHDVIRDMALWIANGKQYFVRTGDQRLTEVPNVGSWEDKNKVSLMSNNIKKVTENPNCPDLVTLFLCDNDDLKEISGCFFQNMDTLKILDLSNTPIEKLPVDVSKLKLLQYLNLSNTDIEELPIELGQMLNLKYLNLEDTIYLGLIPRGLISSFLSLRVLKMYNCGSSCKEVGENSIWSSGDIFAQEFQDLKLLQELTTTVRDTLVLQSFSRNRILFRSIQALVFKHVTGSKSLNIWSLASMEQLQKLACDDLDVYADQSDPEPSERQVRNRRPKHNVEISRMQYFISLREVTVENCNNLVDLTWVVMLPRLTILKVESCINIEEIINDRKFSKLSVEGEMFQRMEILVLYSLPKLRSIYSKTLPLPNLNRISVRLCQMLKRLPLNSARAAKCTIRADRAFVYEDEETK